jgi:outer membrane protein assembly factor BamA
MSAPYTRLLPTAWLATVLVARAAFAQDPVPDPILEIVPAEKPAVVLPGFAELEASGLRIGEIRIEVHDVFDTEIPGESGALYRAANKLHINTRQSVVQKQLLFKSGDPVDARLIAETERLLRTNDYFYDVVIEPFAVHDDVVDVQVRTRDVWTLNPGFSFSRSGGENSVGFELEEKNLLGTGQQLSIDWSKDVDRESILFGYFDPHFFRSWHRFGVQYMDADDGQTYSLRYEQPFYALDTRRAWGVQFFDGRREESRYVLGDSVGEFAHDDDYVEMRLGRSNGLQDGWVRRWTFGLTYDRSRFETVPSEPLLGPLPVDRELLYPWIGFELVEDAYRESVNQDQIRRTEDVLLGWRASARLGLAADDAGSDRNALIVAASLQRGFDLGPGHALTGALLLGGRVEEQEGVQNGVLEAEARYYRPTGKKWKFFASASGALTEELDDEYQLLLGGDNGLRGYPLRYQAGTARALFTAEQRYYTDWYPFRLFHVAAAAFGDVGRTWGTDVTGADSLGWLKDVGVGLRLGSSRSSFGNVIHIDLAFPLDGDDSIDSVQFLIETKGRF